MTRAPRRPSDPDLDEREVEVLKSVVLAHLASGEPVGSRMVAEGAFRVGSPATVRSVMAALEERGLLVQPHTSAGRVPTDAAWRFYVDHLMGRPRMAAASAQAIEATLSASRGEIEELLSEASRLLSRFSKQIGVVVAPEIRAVVVEKLEFVRLSDRRTVAVIVGRSGIVNHRVLELEEPVHAEELDRIGRYLTDEFSGMTLPEMREELLRRMHSEREAHERWTHRGHELARRAAEADSGAAGVFVDGTANLLDSPEFADVGRMRNLVRALEEKRRLVGLLGRVLEGRGVQVLIGDEAAESGLESCSLVASAFAAGGTASGTIGIVGPTRMEYLKAVALVEHFAQVLSRLLSPPEDERGRG